MRSLHSHNEVIGPFLCGFELKLIKVLKVVFPPYPKNILRELIQSLVFADYGNAYDSGLTAILFQSYGQFSIVYAACYALAKVYCLAVEGYQVLDSECLSCFLVFGDGLFVEDDVCNLS